MSRNKRWEEVEERMPDMSADELQNELWFWKGRERFMWGSAVKLYTKWIHRLERALEIKQRDEAE